MACHPCVVVIAALLSVATCDHECGGQSRKHYPVGSCAMFSCSSDHGHHRTHCHDGDCICKSGTCPGPKHHHRDHECLSDTGGTCGMFSCKSKRGDTVCHQGHCLCKHLHEESVDGVCTDTSMLNNMTAAQLLATDPDLQFQASDGFTVLQLGGNWMRLVSCFAIGLLGSVLLGVVFFMRRHPSKTAPTGYAHLSA